MSYPEPLYLCCALARVTGRTDGYRKKELQGTRILGSSRATPHRQTVIVINIFSLNYVMCIEGGKTGKKHTGR